MIFHFEDVLTTKRFTINTYDDLKNCISNNPNIIRFYTDLELDFSKTLHMSIIARTRAGKCYLAGCYLAEVMLLQGWEVKYNSAKRDVYFEKFGGEFEPFRIVECAEFYCEIMLNRLETIDSAGKEKYYEVGLCNIGLYFDEIGNLNAALESKKDEDKYLSEDELKDWINAFRFDYEDGKIGLKDYTIFFTTFILSNRKAESYALRRKNIDSKNSLLRITYSLDKYGNIKSTKGNKKTIFNIPIVLTNLLKNGNQCKKKS